MQIEPMRENTVLLDDKQFGAFLNVLFEFSRSHRDTQAAQLRTPQQEMDYLSRIKSTVVDTVSNLSSVLTGNPLSGQYEIGSYLGSYGPCLYWKMYHAIKRSTREEACVFLLEKKSLDR